MSSEHPKDCACKACYEEWQTGRRESKELWARKGERRKKHILSAAVEVARVDRYALMTAEEVAKAARSSRGLITLYFGSMPELREEVMRQAIRLEIPEIVFQGLAVGCPIARSAPLRLKAKAVEPFSGL